MVLLKLTIIGRNNASLGYLVFRREVSEREIRGIPMKIPPLESLSAGKG